VRIFLDPDNIFTDISSMQQFPARLSLLGLPTEIRLKIWEYVLGNRTVHIIFPGLNRGKKRKGFPIERLAGVWRHTVCVAEVFYEAAYILPIWSERSGEHLPDFDMRKPANRHFNCFDHISDIVKHGCFPGNIDRQLSIDILEVCQQTYEEANPILWHTNTWSIQRPLEFEQFMMRRTPEQRRMMTKMHLEIDPYYDSIGYTWNVVLGAAPFSDFSGLTRLHIDIARSIRNLFPSKHSPDPEARLLLPSLLKGFESLMRLPLKEVKVICSPGNSFPEIEETSADRLYARLLEEMLMRK
jgi:hypothetical protein